MFFFFFWGLEGLGRIRDVGQLVQVEPVVRKITIG